MEVWTGGFRVAKPCALCAVIEVFPIAASSMWMCNCNRQNINTHSVRHVIPKPNTWGAYPATSHIRT